MGETTGGGAFLMRHKNSTKWFWRWAPGWVVRVAALEPSPAQVQADTHRDKLADLMVKLQRKGEVRVRTGDFHDVATQILAATDSSDR